MANLKTFISLKNKGTKPSLQRGEKDPTVDMF
jgi:hypothetical protein